jgi:predicted Zn-dependent protease with MMP-like domain
VIEIERAAFEEIVQRAIDDLPPEFGDKIANVEFAVEDWGRPDDYARSGTPGNAVLLGVYRGIPLTKRGAHYNMTLPDRIVIFQQPLQRLASDEGDLERRVQRVVRHEIAHYFGISDDRLHEIDAY